MSTHTQSLTGIALQKFKKNFWGVSSFWFITILILLSVFAYVIAPDKSTNANQMHLSIHSKPPGFDVLMLHIKTEEPFQKTSLDWLFGKQNNTTEIPVLNYKFENGNLIYTEYSDDPIVALTKNIPVSELSEFISISEFEKQNIQKHTYYLGTDKYGRDLLSRMLIGSRVSLSIGFVAVFISLIVGIFFGAIGGYFGGKIDAFVMWLVNIIWSIPTLLLVIAITLSLGKGFWQVFVAVGLTMWVEVARVVRGQIISAKEMQYVTAARALGFGNFRIITRHILPNIMAPIIVISAANFASAILVESGLSFLGLGAQPPIPSWGGMIKDHYSAIILGKPYLALIPGFAIMFLTLAFMMLGNALRDAFDVKS